MSIGFSIGGFDVKGWMVAVALPVLSAVSGAVYFGYDTLKRFEDAEASAASAADAIPKLEGALLDQQATTLEMFSQATLESEKAAAEVSSRIQTLEQAIADNDVRGLSERLATLTTSMQQLLEQQKVLLDLRSDVDRAITITNSIGDKLDTYDTEINDIWTAYDSLVDNPLGN